MFISVSVYQHRMTVPQEFHENLALEENTSNQERSILLVDIMNAIGFSKSERDILRHRMHLTDALKNIFNVDDISSSTRGSRAEGMCGGVHNKSDHDHDLLFTMRSIKLFTPRTNNTDNPTPSLLHDNVDYDASFYVEEDDNFPGYVKLLFAEVKSNSDYLHHCRRINDKMYFSNSAMMIDLSEPYDTSSTSYTDALPEVRRFIDTLTEKHINGPAQTNHLKSDNGFITKIDCVFCIHYDMWPNSAKSFISRRRPNNWPSNSMLENIQSQGCDVAPVGHHDSQTNDIQWRISFPGELNLFLDLTEVQILCYALIKIILKENLNTSQREVVSSFHLKQVIFWCVERCSCKWEHSNYINCLNICLAKLIEMIKARHIPHYFIESRNVFNSKMTEKMSTEIVDVLSKYDTTHVFALEAFEQVLEITHYNNAAIKRETLRSTILACFMGYANIFCFFFYNPSDMWCAYIPHDATASLLKYMNILQSLEKVEGMVIPCVKYFVRSMLGFLYYAKYKESNTADFLPTSKRLIQESLDLDNSCIKLRAATFYLTNQEYRQSIEICDTFRTFLPRHIEIVQYVIFLCEKLLAEIFIGETTADIENAMKEILPIMYSSVKLEYLPGNYEIAQKSLGWIFRNFTNIFFHDLKMDVSFMTAEKWVVPDPIQYELLSLPQPPPHPNYVTSGIYLDPVFVCLQTKLLCYHSLGDVKRMAVILTVMSMYITNMPLDAKTNYVYLNMFTYCQIKAGHHRQSVKSILRSLDIFPSRYNAASGYLKIVLQILKSLSI
jgi:hypothetical protein